MLLYLPSPDRDGITDSRALIIYRRAEFALNVLDDLPSLSLVALLIISPTG